MLDEISFLLALFSIVLSYWFWKNPIDIKEKTKRVLYDTLENGDSITYVITTNYRGWLVKKVVHDIRSETKIEKLYASNKNNPSKISPPENIEEIKMLNFD